MVDEGTELLQRAGIPVFAYPDVAVRMFTYLWRDRPTTCGCCTRRPSARRGRRRRGEPRARARVIDAARAAGRTVLSEDESKEILSAYAIPVAETRVATSVDAAVDAADAIGYPVVVKLYSHTITHKTDVDGVRSTCPMPMRSARRIGPSRRPSSGTGAPSTSRASPSSR
jgi:acetyltransferase